MSQQVAILGAGGFVGSRLIQHFQANDSFSPIGIYRSPNKIPGQLHEKARICDATDTDQLAKTTDGIRYLINCVSGKGSTITQNASALAKLAQARPEIQIIHLSSVSVYGSALGEVDETSALEGNTDAYSRRKTEADASLRKAGAIVLRPGIIYGKGSRLWTERIGGLLLHKRLGDLGIAGDGICNLVYVDDVMRSIENTLLRSNTLRGEAINIVASNPSTWNEYFIEFAKAYGYVPVKRIGKRRLLIESKLIAPPLKILELVQERIGISGSLSPKPIAPSQLRLFRQRISIVNDKACSLFGFDWTSLASGLEKIRRLTIYDDPSEGP